MRFECLIATLVLAGTVKFLAVSGTAMAQQVSEHPSETKEWSPTAAPPEKKVAEIRFDDLRFRVSKGEPVTLDAIPGEVKKRDGSSVRIRGYISPTSVFQTRGIKRFVLVRDHQEMYPWPIHDHIVVRLSDGQSTNFTVRPITVEGKFRVTDQYKQTNGELAAVYEMTESKIVPVKPARSR